MSVFASSIRHNSFWWQISTLCFVLGLLLASAAFTATQINRAGVGPSNPALSYGSGMQVAIEKSSQLETEIKKLRDRNTELENKLALRDDASSTLNKELQSTKFYAMLTDAVGPGVQVVLNDVKSSTAPAAADDPLFIAQSNLIHDEDVARVVNELKAAGAEAVAVNGQRISATTAIRCVGPVVHINFVPCAPPYVIQAIGDPAALFNGMNLQRGVLDDLRRNNPAMVQIEKKNHLKLPGFNGATQMRYARPEVKEEKKEKGSGDEKAGDEGHNRKSQHNKEGQ